MTNALFWFRRNSRPVSYVLRARPCAAPCPGVAIGLKAGRDARGRWLFLSPASLFADLSQAASFSVVTERQRPIGFGQ